ncbi:TcaA 3rd/4th domain-containing protein [Cohnella hongkongensis]|uniref:PEGA domain-containing protein n=1 Tax=Cohnella hongkongensis TaxID=178337 RepID=A0ABV9FF88_9BACL
MTSKNKKITIGAAAFVVLAAVGLYFLGGYLADGQRLIERFESSVEKRQPDKLLKLLAASEDGREVDRASAEGIVEFLRTDEEALRAVLSRLKTEISQLEDGAAQSFASDGGSAFVYAHKKEKKRWLFYDDYELKLRSYKVPVNTNFGGARILLNGEDAGIAGVDGSRLELGPLLPGEYTVKAIYAGKYTTLENEVRAKLFPLGGSVQPVEVPLKGEYVDIFANNSFARIIINGEDIGLTVDGGQRIGPIAVDGSNTIRLEVDYPWGTTQSEERPIDGTKQEFELSVLTSEAKEQILDAAHAFVASWYEAFRERDAQRLRSVHPDRRADLAGHFADMVAGDEHYTGELRSATFDRDSLRIDQLGASEYTVSVLARVEYEEAYYYGAFDLRPEPVAGAHTTIYRLQYENGGWLVSDWSDAGSEALSSNVQIYDR